MTDLSQAFQTPTQNRLMNPGGNPGANPGGNPGGFAFGAPSYGPLSGFNGGASGAAGSLMAQAQQIPQFPQAPAQPTNPNPLLNPPNGAAMMTPPNPSQWQAMWQRFRGMVPPQTPGMEQAQSWIQRMQQAAQSGQPISWGNGGNFTPATGPMSMPNGGSPYRGGAVMGPTSPGAGY